MGNVIDSIRELLAGHEPPQVATQITTAPGRLKLQVSGVGPIHFPVSPASARRLCKAARPARHGFKDQTRLDPKVRDTWEISRERISIDAARWKPALDEALDRMGGVLGIPRGQRLKAQLHNLLIYAPGQFFLPHRDSEKADGMLGTLVVTLPSSCSGGELAIVHQGTKQLFAGSSTELTLTAFYGDCRHEVRPVRRGYRIALTYNLVVQGEPAREVSAPDRINALAGRIKEFFDTPRRPRWKGDKPVGPPERLVYLLDHQYTQAGLGWSRLKGADTASAAALREAARRLDCEICLALADVHEVWTCEDAYEDHGDWDESGENGEYLDEEWDADEDLDQDEDSPEEDEDFEDEDLPGTGRSAAEAPELIELIDNDIELRHWAGADAPPYALARAVTDEELCFTKESSELDPFNWEHEGYTGNEGSTVERWYHRAAVVLWPRERTLVVRAKASPRWGLQQIAGRLKARAGLSVAQETARHLLPFWKETLSEAEHTALLAPALPLAVQLADPQLAAGLLAPFRLTALPPRSTGHLADLLEAYGEGFWRSLLKDWTRNEDAHGTKGGRLAWIGTTLVPLCQALSGKDTPAARKVARQISCEQWGWLQAQLKDIPKIDTAIERRMWTDLSEPLLGLIEAASGLGDAGLRRQILSVLKAGPLPAQSAAIPLMRAAQGRRRGKALRELGLSSLHAHCAKELRARLKGPATAAGNDWAIEESLSCSCKLCNALGRWLRAGDQARLEWPLAASDRGHIHRAIDLLELPVTHETQREGRPHVLVLEKTQAVSKRATAARRGWEKDLEWLEATDRLF
jgi:hypothetical protein